MPAGCATLVLLAGEWFSTGVVCSGLAWRRRCRCFFVHRRFWLLNLWHFHAWPCTPLMPHPYLTLHADAHFDNRFGFPARHTRTRLGHVALALPGKRLSPADTPMYTTGKDMLQGHLGQRPVGRFRLLRRHSEQPVVLVNQFRQHPIGFLHGAHVAQAKFDHQTILKGSPKPLDASFGLRKTASICVMPKSAMAWPKVISDPG